MGAVLILALAGWCGPPLASAAKPARKAAPPKAEAGWAKANRPAKTSSAGQETIRVEDVLRYLPDDCQAFGWIDPGAILRSGAARQGKLDLEKSGTFWRDQAAITGLEIDQAAWIAFGGAAEGWGQADVKPRAVAVVRSAKALRAPSNDAPDGWKRERIGGREVFCQDGPDPLAVCFADERTVLVGTPPDSLRAALKRQRPAKLPDKLARAVRTLDRTKGFSVAFVLPEKLDGGDWSRLSISREIAQKIDAAVLEMDFKDDVALRLAAACQDEATALQIKGIAVALWSIVEAQGLDDQGPDARELVRSVRISQAGPVVSLDLRVPAGMLGKSAEGETATSACCPWAPAAASPGTLSGVVPFTASPSSQARAPVLAPCPPTSSGPPVAYGAPAAADGSPASGYPATSGYAPAPVAPSYGTSSGPASRYVSESAYTSPGSSNYASSPSPRTPVDVAEVARLAEAKVPDEAILVYLTKRRLTREITADDLILLTGKGASERLLRAVQELPFTPADKANPPPSSPPAQPEAAGKPHSAWRPGKAPLPVRGELRLQSPPSQVLWIAPEGVTVRWDVSRPGAYDGEALVCPGRADFPQGGVYQVKFSSVPGRPGVELLGTLEVANAGARAAAFLANSAIPMQLTDEDCGQILGGRSVVKVVYLPDPEYEELALAGVETLVSTRLDPDVDATAEAKRRGTIVAVLRFDGAEGPPDARKGAAAGPAPSQRLIYTSEDLRRMLDEWERMWMLDPADGQAPLRTHGGVL